MVLSLFMICLAKSRLIVVTSVLRVSRARCSHFRQLSLFSSSVGRSDDVSFTVKLSNTPSRCEIKMPFVFLMISRSLREVRTSGMESALTRRVESELRP